MTIRFQMASPEQPVTYTPGKHLIRATTRTHRTVELDLRPTSEQGRDAWTYLHTTTDDPEAAIVKFEAMIPSYSCDCKKDYKTIKNDHPFDTSSPDAFFVSGVHLHNAVNQKLMDKGDTTKRIVSLEEARAIWNRPEPA